MIVLCSNDSSILTKTGEKKTSILGRKKQVIVPLYECPTCKGKYTVLENCREKVTIRVDGVNYSNISVARNKKRCMQKNLPVEEIIAQQKSQKVAKKKSEKTLRRKREKRAKKDMQGCKIEFWGESKNENSPEKEISKVYEHDNSIGVKDFVIRRTTFRCLHKEHQLRNIQGNIDIIDKDGNVRQVSVPAGYCPNCNLFFIMESTYQVLKSKGTPRCRVSDEKTYLKNGFAVNGMRLARESILMQYGYSVSQEEGLTTIQRRKILANLVDDHILTRADIISYLDFFISQRSRQPKYEKAIEKWENDREFISEYKAGKYTQFGISGIYRKA